MDRLICLLLLALLLAPQGRAQAQTPDAAIVDVYAPEAPIVNVDASVVALVSVSFPTTVTVEFRYGDGTPIASPNSPGGVGFRTVRPIDTPGTYSFPQNFTPPPERRGDQIIRVTVTTPGDSDATNNAIAQHFFVRDPLLNLTFDRPRDLNVTPGGVSFVRFFVRNDGNAPDAPSVQWVRDPAWELTFEGNNSTLPEIAPGRSATGVILVRPLTSNASLDLTSRIIAFSSIFSTVTASAEAPPLHVNDSALDCVHMATLGEFPSRMELFPGENVNVTLLVTNSGNIDDVFDLNATVDDIAWNVRLSPGAWALNASHATNGSKFELPLRAGEGREVLVSVDRGDGRTPHGNLTVNVSSVNKPLLADPQLAPTTTIRSVLSEAGPDLTVASITAPGVSYVGEPMTVSTRVHNAGRVDAPASTLHLALRDNLRTLDETDLKIPSLSAGEDKILVWTRPLAETSGDQAITARVSVNSTGFVDEDPSNDAMAVMFHVRAPSITVRAPAEVGLTPESTTTLASSDGGIAIQNTGDRDEVVRAFLNATPQWLQRMWTVTVPAGGVAVLPLKLDVPRYPGAPAFSTTIHAEILDHPKVSTEAAVHWLVNDSSGPDLVILGPEPVGTAGTAATLLVRADDASGVGRVEALVGAPDGSVQQLILTKSNSAFDNYDVDLLPIEAGTYSIEFRAEDKAEVTHGASATLTWVVEPSNFAALRPANFVDGGAISTKILRFMDAGGGRTASVSVDVGGGFVPLPPPYSVDVSAWQEGAHLVHARGVSVEGARWTANWTVTLKTEPPTLSDPAVSETGSTLTLQVRVNGARNVTARILTPAGAVQVPLSRGSDGVFDARVPRPASWQMITFIAKDDAGNTNSITLAGASRPAPALGSAAVLAVVGAVAALARRVRP